MAICGGIGVVEAVREFLEDGTHGGATSPADTFNDFLATYRTDHSLTTDDLPNVAQYEKIWARGSQATKFPYCAIVWDGSTGEAVDDGINQRQYVHRPELVLVVTQEKIKGDEQKVVEAAVRYHDCFRAFFARRLPKGEQGWTLNNGGSGAAQSRILRCEVEAQDNQTDGLTPPNAYVLVRLMVRAQEDY